MSVPPEVAVLLREMVDVPDEVRDLATRFVDAGHELYIVGGYIRDSLLRRDLTEVDFATDAGPDRVRELVSGWHEGTWLQGIEFGTVGVQKGRWRLEITTYRAETYAPDSRNPQVKPVRTIEADLARRDFTINAIAARIPDLEFLDPFGGVADLASKTLRTPGAPEDSFGDDPLRMLRAARFVAQLDLEADPALVAAMKAMASRLSIISAERIRDEFTKMLAAEHPSRGLDLATETGLCDRFLPELPALRLQQDPIHRHKDVYAHTLAVVDKLVASDGPNADVVLRVAGLLHDIGKPDTRRIDEHGVSFHHHEVVGARMAEERLRALRFDNHFIDEVCHLVAMHLRFHGFSRGWSDAAVRRYVRDAGSQLDRLNRLVRADCTTRNKMRARKLAVAMDQFEERIAKLAAEEDLKRIRPPIDGHDVMTHLKVPPGRIVGDALAMLLEHRLEHGEFTREEAFRILDAWAADQA